tara:strand:+ start:141 stop:374 length:234 start_codon:yes stop_codon:yes gene_type:complete
MPSLDLHGYYIQDAWREFTRFVHDNKYQGLKYVTVITGQGKIKEEFELWVEANDSLKKCELLPTNGAYKVYYNKEYK